MACKTKGVNIQQEDLTVHIAVNIFQRQSFYYPLQYLIALRETKLTVPLNMDLGSLRPLAYCNYGFESHRRHGCLYLQSVVRCQVEVSATSRSLFQRSPTRRNVSQWVSSRNLLGEARTRKGCTAMIKKLSWKSSRLQYLLKQLSFTTAYCCHILVPFLTTYTTEPFPLQNKHYTSDHNVYRVKC
jgi:hypothetical protein